MLMDAQSKAGPAPCDAPFPPLNVGLIGTGRISDIYLETCTAFSAVNISACGSLDPEESRRKAAHYGIAKVASPQDIIADDTIDCILNLTIPAVHAEVSLAALAAGKHVYSEKPLATTLQDGQRILDLAAARGLTVGNAPDTFLGGRWQTVRKLLDDGVIGTPIGCMAHVGTHGVERHNPNPDFYYQHGGGPLLDLGPYYLTAMVFLMGPIKRVSGMASRSFDRRQIETGPRSGDWMNVEVDTHSLSTLEFVSGAIGNMTISFDIWDSESPRFEIYGTEGTICIPDPDPVHGANNFGGPVWYRTRKTSRWEFQPRPTDRPDTWLEAENTHGFNVNSRGLGLVEMAYALNERRTPRASGELAQHVLEVMLGIDDSPRKGQFIDITSTCAVPPVLPNSFPGRVK
jgi:predicted dehydrogenase